MFFLKHIIDDALAAVDPCRLIVDQIHIQNNTLFIQNRLFDLSLYRRLHVLGVGKGAPFLFAGLNQVLGDQLAGGVVVGLPEHRFNHPRVAFFPGTHPIPDKASLEAGREVLNYIETQVTETDLVFFLLTGGASALLVQPVAGVSLMDKIEITCLLLASGAEIQEINCVRKILSAIKGGNLARRIYPARVISLIVSDIVDSPLADIGSGPTIPNHVKSGEVLDILDKYHLMPHVPPAIYSYLMDHEEEATERDKGLEENVHFLLADNHLALEAAQQAAKKLGIDAHILTSRDHGDVTATARFYAALIKEIINTNRPFKPPVLLLSGGELTVTLTSPQHSRPITGMGGRNQEFVLHLLNELKTVSHPFYIASLGTDGIDGPTDAAGGWIDQQTMAKTTAGELETALQNHDSYRMLNKLNQLFKIGPTRTNVMDMRLFYIDSPQSQDNKE